MTNIIKTPKMNNVKLWNLDIRGAEHTRPITHMELLAYLKKSPDKIEAVYPAWNWNVGGGVK